MKTITKANSNVIFAVFMLSMCKIRSKMGVRPNNVACRSFGSVNIHFKQAYSTMYYIEHQAGGLYQRFKNAIASL